MGGGPPSRPKIPSNQMVKFNDPSPELLFDHYDQHDSQFSGMQPNEMISSNGNQSHGGRHPMYSEDKNYYRSKSNMMHHQMSRRNAYSQNQHEGFNRNYQSHLNPVN